MPLKTIAWAAFFAVTVVGALWNPLLGVVGYIGHYCIGADRQWWNAPLSGYGIRYSCTLAIATAVGIVLNWRKLSFGRSLLHRPEKLALVFLGIVWLSTLIGPETVGRYTRADIDHPSMKLTKILIFAFMLTHVVTTKKDLDRLLWVFILGAFILGHQAWSTPLSAFNRGRLESVGGPDFAEANFFGTFMAGMLPIIGVMFLRSRWIGKTACLLAGAFTANAIVLARSRGAFVGLALGMIAAALVAPRRHRGKIAIGLAVAIAGGVYLSDPQFIDRMSTITTQEEQMGGSAASRMTLWRGGMAMLADHPFGVGAGNFYQSIGRYAPGYDGKDAHNTYVRCACELGIQGIAVFAALIFVAGRSLWKLGREVDGLPPEEQDRRRLLSYGMLVAMVTVLGGCITMSLTYVEYLWWFLLMPVCLIRSAENEPAPASELDKFKELKSRRKQRSSVRKRRASTRPRRRVPSRRVDA